MNKSIRINNYFFNNITNYTPKRNKPGSTRRMPFGKIKSYHPGVVFFHFNITLEQLSPVQLGHLIYLDNLCNPLDDSEPQVLEFWGDTNGDAFDIEYPVDVIIPYGNGFDFTREEGINESYTAELRLEQVMED
ncbi:MAG: hypothetical protein ACOCRO_07325 [Halanaerobiales bacterium]